MFGSSLDDQYLNRAEFPEAATESGRRNWWVLAIILSGILVFIIWATFFEIEEVTSGTGKVIPSSQTQIVQSLEGGIVREVAVQEGQQVDRGQILMQIDDTGFASQLGELEQKKKSLQAEQYRLQAEASGKRELRFAKEFAAINPTLVSAELEVFSSRLRQLDGELEVLNDRLDQRLAELQELSAERKKLETTAVPLRQETKLTKQLVQRGVVPKVDLLRLESRLAEIEGDIEVAKAAEPKINASITEARKQLGTTRNTYQLAARERLAKLEGEISIVAETMRAAADRVSRTQLRSPVRGIVNKINFSTIGAVVQPGNDLIEIVPSDDGLLIEAQIRPQDVAFIRAGGKASVKLTAYDYLIYGMLEGEVVRIGADSQQNANGDQFFRVIVKTTKNYLGDNADKNLIIPGMVASIDIQTGKNTVLSYLMKPVLRARAEALRER